ncbi:MAG: Hsp70 family protein [Spirochaetota bacterium]
MEPILGIDFGTTNSAAALYQGGRAQVIPTEYGERVLPSAVYIDTEGNIFVGTPARNVAVLHGDATVLSVKRRLGTGMRFFINNTSYTPERIASFILRKVRQLAERHTGGAIRRTVITVPASFDDHRRRAVSKAAREAGLEVARVINEPTAAALAFGLQRSFRGTVAVFDLGGGTFDISILRVEEGMFEVLATRGDVHLGGDDFDRKIAEQLTGGFREEHGVDLSGDAFAMQKIAEEAEKIKKQLSAQQMVEVHVPFISADENGPLDLRAVISREEFERMINREVERALRLTGSALRDAGLRPADVDLVLPVGGSTRIPLVRSRLQAMFGREPERGISPDEVVAVGAAVQGAVIEGRVKQVALVDVTPLGLGVETEGGKMVTMIRRNTPIPARSQAVFTTVADDQKAVTVNILQGERPLAEDNHSVGSFRLDGIRLAPRGEPRILVSFDIDVDGMVTVSAEDQDTGAQCGVTVDAVSGLTGEEVDAVLADARASELDDLVGSGRRAGTGAGGSAGSGRSWLSGSTGEEEMYETV